MECMLGLLLLLSTPNRPEAKQPTPPAVPNIAMISNWGTITQDGRKIKIEGNVEWFAEGEIRKDGKLLLLWTQLIDVLPTAPALYTINKDLHIHGVWGWSDYVEMNEAGELTGELEEDTIYNKGAKNAPQ